MCEGIALELEGIDLGDKRLNDRSVKILESLAAQPERSINASTEGWGDTVATYRFFNHQKVTPEEILQPHIEATKRRIRDQRRVLIVQDTTELDFTAHPPKDAQCLDQEHRFGYYEHSHLAVTPDKLALGLVGSETFHRAPETLGKADERSSLPIEEKESMRWLTGYRLAASIARDFPDTHIISVADREADIHDIFAAAEKGEFAADFVIRAKENRCTTQRDPTRPRTYHKVWDEVAQSPRRGTHVVDLPATPKRAARTAVVEIRAMTIEIQRPKRHLKLPNVTLNVVYVREVNGPGDDTDIEWKLLTTLPIDTFEQILEILNIYTARWPIEIFFRTLKTGCKAEDMQLETTHRVLNCLAFYKIIAWRLMYLTFMNRQCPTLPCTAMFDDDEWKPVWCVVTKKPLPKKTPTLAEIMKLVAHLGGYNNRPNEPPPGVQVIWMGLRRMCDFAVAWKSFGPDH
jgi:hypothetical protein